MDTLPRPDGTLVYEVAGAGPPLLLVTGLGGSRHYWASVRDRLTPHFTVVTHDHMGTGDTVSRRSSHTVEALAADVVALMDHLAIPKAHLVGHSTGAAVGQILGAEAPERLDGLVLYAGWAGPDPYFDQCFKVRKELLLGAGTAAYHRATPLFLYPPDWIAADAARLEALVGGMIASSPPSETMAGRVDMLLNFDRRAWLPSVRARTLVLCASDDTLTPPHLSREMAQAIPGAELALVPWGGHALSQTAPDAFLSHVMAALT